jgi:hypothetical protein
MNKSGTTARADTGTSMASCSPPRGANILVKSGRCWLFLVLCGLAYQTGAQTNDSPLAAVLEWRMNTTGVAAW